MFNATIGLLDNTGAQRPYLAEQLPRLNTDDWRISPDGRMETHYRLKANVTWHDGTPLSAEDFVFGWRVYTTPSLGHAGGAPFREIEAVEARDASRLIVRWKQPYPDVAFTENELPPLPRHILESTFDPDQTEAFVNHGFWTRDYVGLGPYRLSQWEPGAFIEGTAFDSHILGKARIDKVRLEFYSDARAALARILSGDAQLTDGTSVGLPEVAVLKQEWIAQGKGNVIIHPNQWRAVHFQNRPELATPPILLNRTVRKALGHLVDKATLNDTLYYGLGAPADSPIPASSIWARVAEQNAVRYPFDPRQAEALMQEAGFRKGGDGVYTNPTAGRLSWITQTNAGSDNESEMSILASGWRTAGFDVQESVLSAAEARDPEKRSTFPATFSNSAGCCESALRGFSSANVSTAEKRWTGGNRTGWTNPEYDRLLQAFSRTLDQSERQQQVGQMVRILTEDMESISLLIRGQPWVHVAALKGIAIVPPEGNMSWNIHEWQLQEG
jgi:peptide/nickel transport system substrate-binding protein